MASFSQLADNVSVALSVSQAAGGAGVKNVCTYFNVTIQSSGIPFAASWLLRDGATVVGTVIATGRLTSTDGVLSLGFDYDGPPIIGSANTIMTLEFGQAIVGVRQTVALYGFTY